jgi:hypothetical protein
MQLSREGCYVYSVAMNKIMQASLACLVVYTANFFFFFFFVRVQIMVLEPRQLVLIEKIKICPNLLGAKSFQK